MEGENSQLQCSWPPPTPFKDFTEETRENQQKQVDWFVPGFGLGREGQVNLSSFDFAAKGKEKVVNVSDDGTNGIGIDSELLGVMGSFTFTGLLGLSDGIGGQSCVSVPDCSTNVLFATQDHLNFVPDTSHPMPKTPVKAGRAENTQVTERRELPVGENEEMIDPTSQPVTDSAGNKKIDLNKTPQKKPIRKRKHRPKIVTEGKKKPKQNLKPVTVKRKYVQRKGVNKSTSMTPSAEIVNGDLADNSCRRALDYTLEDGNMLKSKTRSGAISLKDSNRGTIATATEARARESKRKRSPVMEQASSANRTEVDQGSGHWVDFPDNLKRKRSRNRPKLVASSHLHETKSDAMQPRKSGRQGLKGNQRTKLYLMPSTRPERLAKRASLNKPAVCEVRDIFPGKEGLLKHIVSTMGPAVPKKKRVFNARAVNADAIAVVVHAVDEGVDAAVTDAGVDAAVVDAGADAIVVDVRAVVADAYADAAVVNADAIVVDVSAIVVDDAGADAVVVNEDVDAAVVDANVDADADAAVVNVPAIVVEASDDAAVVDTNADAISMDVPAIVVDKVVDAINVDVPAIHEDASVSAAAADSAVVDETVDATANAIVVDVAAADIDVGATVVDANVDPTDVYVSADATIVAATAASVNATVVRAARVHTDADADAAAKKLRWRGFIKEIIEWLKQLDINRESDSVMQERNALVLYRNDGTVVPYNPIKTKAPRAKVDLDEETNNMFLLLLKNINHEGVDGSDEEKQRWWEEERRVFCGRADSFVARMHLIQGDRRFSEWKGSVVDSVIGVFLTQNVSDHLSSSAYLSLAARFPLKSNSNQKPVHEEEVVEVYNLELDSEQTTELRSIPYQHVSGQSTLRFQDNDHNADKVAAEGNLSPGIKNIDVSLTEIMNCSSLNFPKSNAEPRDIALDKMISSQESVTSYQKICERPIAENDERIGSYSQANPEAEKLVNRLQSNGLNDTASLMDILTMAGPTMLCQDSSSKRENSKDSRFLGDLSKLAEISTSQGVVQENNQSSNHQGEENNKVQQTTNLPNISREMDTAESAIVNEEKNDEEKAEKDRALKEKNSMKQKSKRVGREINDDFDWDTLRREVEANGKKEREMNTMDSLDWEAVRRADVDEIAETIKDRGMHNQLAARIKAFLNRVVNDHGSIDLEWVREIEPDKAKEYLLSVNGLGLKSVECIRLLALQHLAFPVDTNVGRIAVRLGWVPLQPLPESLQLHLLELYPVMDSIQKYLWPRLCKLQQKDLYELHYQMITFGKVFCTKRKPNCNACPMRGECRHFASAFASARLALPAPEEKGIVCSSAPERTADPGTAVHASALFLPPPQATQQSEGNLQEGAGLRLEPKHRADPCEPIIELPEEPASPEPESTQYQENDIEDYQYIDDPDDIPEIKLNVEEFTRNLQCYMENNMELQEGEMSKALVALTPGEASIPMPKLKNVSRLRTEHQVYELPDSHPLLEGMDKREADDPCPYLVAIWTPGETANSIKPPEGGCSYQESGKLCDQKTCFACSSILEARSQIVRGTLLIPCRTATRGRFPLNGTYFQVNEVFADHASSLNPIDIPRAWMWKLTRRTVYFATSVTSIFRGLSTDEIQHCFWRGYVCVRGFDQITRAPRPLVARLHFSASRFAAKEKR